MLTQRPTPAFMSQEAARRLPRFALALLLAVFILSSFWADGLWTLRDAAGFGVAQSMTNGGLEAWLLPQIQGTPFVIDRSLGRMGSSAFHEALL